jgi:hypothetical protein
LISKHPKALMTKEFQIETEELVSIEELRNNSFQDVQEVKMKFTLIEE